MKNILASLVMIATASVLEAQSPPAQPEPPPWAEKLFGAPENLVHDFGIVPRGAQLRHDFVVTNIYTVPIEITSVRGTPCSCLMAAEPSNRILQPHEKANISVLMDGRRFSGNKSVNVYVTFGPSFVSTVRLTLKAAARIDLVCNPGEIDFDSVAPGQTPSKTIDFMYAGPLAWRINELVVPKDAPFEAAVKELYRRPGEVGYQVKMTLKKDAAPGQFQETIHLKTNEPQAALLPVSVRGTIKPLEATAPESSRQESITPVLVIKDELLPRQIKPNGMLSSVR